MHGVFYLKSLASELVEFIIFHIDREVKDVHESVYFAQILSDLAMMPCECVCPASLMCDDRDALRPLHEVYMIIVFKRSWRR